MHFALHHHLLLGLVVCTSVVALLGSVFVSRAWANHVQCGATLTQSTTFDSNVECTDAANSTFAITIAADNVMLDLAGYSVKAAPSGTQTGIATQLSGGRDVNSRSADTQRHGRGLLQQRRDPVQCRPESRAQVDDHDAGDRH